jgi:hypothetical protein
MAERRSLKILHREEAHEARHCAYEYDNVPVQGITVELHNSVNVNSLKRPAFQDRKVLTMNRAVIRSMELTTGALATETLDVISHAAPVMSGFAKSLQGGSMPCHVIVELLDDILMYNIFEV